LRSCLLRCNLALLSQSSNNPISLTICSCSICSFVLVGAVDCFCSNFKFNLSSNFSLNKVDGRRYLSPGVPLLNIFPFHSRQHTSITFLKLSSLCPSFHLAFIFFLVSFVVCIYFLFAFWFK